MEERSDGVRAGSDAQKTGNKGGIENTSSQVTTAFESLSSMLYYKNKNTLQL